MPQWAFVVERKAQFPLLTHHLLLFKKHFWMINYRVVIILERNVLWYVVLLICICLSVKTSMELKKTCVSTTLGQIMYVLTAQKVKTLFAKSQVLVSSALFAVFEIDLCLDTTTWAWQEAKITWVSPFCVMLGLLQLT